jgi:hypothetical protein
MVRARKKAPRWDAQIRINAGPTGLEFEAECVSDDKNPAVMFAHWIGRNSQVLFLQMVQGEAKERLKLVEPPSRIAGAAALLGPGGKALQ